MRQIIQFLIISAFFSASVLTAPQQAYSAKKRLLTKVFAQNLREIGYQCGANGVAGLTCTRCQIEGQDRQNVCTTFDCDRSTGECYYVESKPQKIRRNTIIIRDRRNIKPRQILRLR